MSFLGHDDFVPVLNIGDVIRGTVAHPALNGRTALQHAGVFIIIVGFRIIGLRTGSERVFQRIASAAATAGNLNVVGTLAHIGGSAYHCRRP